jgi:hypothetical protein
MKNLKSSLFKHRLENEHLNSLTGGSGGPFTSLINFTYTVTNCGWTGNTGVHDCTDERATDLGAPK